MGKQGKAGNGEGSIRQRSDGIWEARLTLSDGRRKSRYDKSRQVVARWLAEARRDRDRGIALVSDERLTVERYLADWLERMQPPRVRPTTHRRYGQQLAHVTRAYGKLRLTRLTAAHLTTLYARLQRPADETGAQDGQARQRALSATSVHHLHVVLRQALDDALKLGLVVVNVADRVDAPKLRRTPIEPFNAEEAQRLLAAAQGERLEALYVVALATGMRLGELLALTWRQVDLDGATLRVVASLQRMSAAHDGWAPGEPKTEHSRREIALGVTAVEALRAHHAHQLAERMAIADVWRDRDLVFCDEVGNYLNPLHITATQLQALLRHAGLPRRRFHDLRHTAATLLLAAGVPLKVVSMMLGHTTIAITADIYQHVTADMQRDAVRALEAILTARTRQA